MNTKREKRASEYLLENLKSIFQDDDHNQERPCNHNEFKATSTPFNSQIIGNAMEGPELKVSQAIKVSLDAEINKIHDKIAQSKDTNSEKDHTERLKVIEDTNIVEREAEIQKKPGQVGTNREPEATTTSTSKRETENLASHVINESASSVRKESRKKHTVTRNTVQNRNKNTTVKNGNSAGQGVNEKRNTKGQKSGDRKKSHSESQKVCKDANFQKGPLPSKTLPPKNKPHSRRTRLCTAASKGIQRSSPNQFKVLMNQANNRKELTYMELLLKCLKGRDPIDILI